MALPSTGSSQKWTGRGRLHVDGEALPAVAGVQP